MSYKYTYLSFLPHTYLGSVDLIIDIFEFQNLILKQLT